MTSTSYSHWLDLANLVQREVDSAGVGKSSANKPDNCGKRSFTDRFDETVTMEALRSASRTLFQDGHYARAVEEAFKRLNNEVKAKSGLVQIDGEKLMRQAFSVHNPTLRLNNLLTTSQKDEQRGYMDLYAGAMTAIRNPRAHEHEVDDPPEVALEMLVLANHLMRMLERSTVSRPQSGPARS